MLENILISMLFAVYLLGFYYTICKGISVYNKYTEFEKHLKAPIKTPKLSFFIYMLLFIVYSLFWFIMAIIIYLDKNRKYSILYRKINKK